MNATDRAPLLGRIVTLTATGEHARPRLAFHGDHEHAGKIEIGLADGTTRLVTAEDYTAAWPIPDEARAIPVFPDAADGSSRPMGTCQRCGITANVISIVAEKGARWHCGAHMVKDRDSRSGWRLAKTRLVCTHCYAASAT